METRGITWTNKSVLGLANGGDPVTAIQAAARDLVLRALEQGWQGPPFSPMLLAQLLKVQTEANANIPDARVYATDAGPMVQYNPQQPRERVRFSIAHELAHLLFPDWQEKIRNRGKIPRTDDDWQLEMLCNLAASEFVLPIGSLPSLEQLPTIEEMMLDRRKYDVSAEAYFNRIARISQEPICTFFASARSDGTERRYKIDYQIWSPTAPDLRLGGKLIPAGSAIKSCTAIGYTETAIEDWATGFDVKIDFVGIPGYPGDLYPRVAGIIHVGVSSSERMPIKYVHGDVFDPRGAGRKIICQLVNDRATKWGGGVARKAAQRFPEAEATFFHKITDLPRHDRMGKVVLTAVSDELMIASVIAQEGFGPSLFPRIRYGALQSAMAEIGAMAKQDEASIHLPRIGTGASGGEWSAIEEILDDTLVRSGNSVTVYDPPPRRKQFELFA